MQNLVYLVATSPLFVRSQEVLATARGYLAEQGWKSEDGAAFARKSFKTAVGPRDAVAYLMHSSSNDNAFRLTASYDSEGRNVLESVWLLIPQDATIGEIHAVIGNFSDGVDTHVAQTYAACLYLRRGEQAQEVGEAMEGIEAAQAPSV